MQETMQKKQHVQRLVGDSMVRRFATSKVVNPRLLTLYLAILA
jgi:hypothetical protein